MDTLIRVVSYDSKVKDEAAPKLASSILTADQASNLARRLPIHKNKVGGQPNDHLVRLHSTIKA